MIVNQFTPPQRKSYQHPGNEYDRRIRTEPRPKATPGASGNGARNSSEGSSIADQREQDRLIRDFVESLTGEDRAFALASGLATPLADPFPRGAGGPAEDDEDGPEDQPDVSSDAGSHNGNALLHSQNAVVDSLEPRAGVSIEELSDKEIAAAHDAFARVIAWVHVPELLIKKARRLATLITHCRPDLGASLPQCPLRTADLVAHLGDYPASRLALVFGRVFAWAREAPSLGTLGVRADIIAYIVRPQLLDAATNAQIGEPLNNTRAAVNKLVQEFRDTFAGIRAPAMRGESTRARCREAQLS